MMDLRRLRCFVAVAEELHFGRAARRLNMAQPPLSQHIRKLEDDLGVQLLLRNRRGVSLTSTGAVLLSRARVILADAADAADSVRLAARGEIGQIAIGHAPPADLSVLPSLLGTFRLRFPKVQLELHSLHGPDLVDFLHRGRISIAIGRFPIDAPDLICRTIFRERLIVALPRSHSLAREACISLRNLTDESFILFPRHLSPRYHDLISAMCLKAGGFPLRVAQESETIQTVLALVAAGLGISLQPESVQNLRRAGVVYRPIRETTPMADIGVAYRNDDMTPTLKQFLTLVDESEALVREDASSYEPLAESDLFG